MGNALVRGVAGHGQNRSAIEKVEAQPEEVSGHIAGLEKLLARYPGGGNLILASVAGEIPIGETKDAPRTLSESRRDRAEELHIAESVAAQNGHDKGELERARASINARYDDWDRALQAPLSVTTIDTSLVSDIRNEMVIATLSMGIPNLESAYGSARNFQHGDGSVLRAASFSAWGGYTANVQNAQRPAAAQLARGSNQWRSGSYFWGGGNILLGSLGYANSYLTGGYASLLSLAREGTTYANPRDLQDASIVEFAIGGIAGMRAAAGRIAGISIAGERGVVRGWSVGDDIYNLTAKGNEPAWSTVRGRFWKNEAANPQHGTWNAQQLERMEQGLAPQRYNFDKGGIESMDLSHEPIPFRHGGRDVVPRWPQDHAAIDRYRRPGY